VNGKMKGIPDCCYYYEMSINRTDD